VNHKDEIYKWFINSNKSGCCFIGGLPVGAEAQLYRDSESYGVMLALDDPQTEIDEHFSNVRLYTKHLSFGESEDERYLILSCRLTGENFSEKFATMCDDFIDPGDGCRKRIDILDNPFSWWADWKKLIGNVDRDKKPHAVLGELISYDHLLSLGENPVWEGAESGTVDIRGKRFDCEDKSTTIRGSKSISVSSTHQLNNLDRELHLYHCCFEQSNSGLCINDMLERLKNHGADMNLIENGLDALGYSKGSSGRILRYRLLSMDDYLIDDDFPRIVPNSFKGGVLPKGIESITYVVSLINLKSVAIDYR